MNAERLHKALLQEILQEQAAALGRAGERLHTALETYRRRLASDDQLSPAEHTALIDDVATKVWELAVQRELIGVQHNNLASIVDVYDIPQEICRRLGHFQEQ